MPYRLRENAPRGAARRGTGPRGTASRGTGHRGQAAEPGRPSLPPFTETVARPSTTYWATVYGFSGETLATAFVGDDGNDQVVVARPVQRPQNRVFIGEIQPSWALGGSSSIRDVDPLPSPRGKGKGRASDVRVYVGDKAPLFLPLKAAGQESRKDPPPVSSPSPPAREDSEFEYSSVLTPLSTAMDCSDAPIALIAQPSAYPASDSAYLLGPGEYYPSTAFGASSNIDVGFQEMIQGIDDKENTVQGSRFNTEEAEQEQDGALLGTETEGPCPLFMSQKDLAKAIMLGLTHIGITVQLD